MATGTAGDVGREYHTHQVHYLRKYFTYADAGTTFTMGTLPPGAAVIDAGVVVATVFNAGTNNRIDIGTEDDTDDFATDLSLLTKGRIVADEMATADNLYSTSAKLVKLVVDVTGTAATTGVAIAYVAYIVAEGAVGSS